MGLDSVVKILSMLVLELACFVFTSAHLHQVSSQRAVSQYHRLLGGTGAPLLLLSCKYTPALIMRFGCVFEAPPGLVGLPRHSTPSSAVLSRTALSSSREESPIHRFSSSAGECVGGENPAVVSRSAGGNKKTIFTFHTYVATKKTFVLFFLTQTTVLFVLRT